MRTKREPTLKAAKKRDVLAAAALQARMARLQTLLSWIEGQANSALAAIERGHPNDAAYYTSEVVRNAETVARLIREEE